MKTIINIKNLIITLPNRGESGKPVNQPLRTGRSYQPQSKETATDGVYIYTENGHLWLPQFWGLSGETPQSVVVIRGEKKLCVSLKGSSNGMMLLDSEKRQTGKCFTSMEDALNDWDGKKNTEKLLRLGSPAAQFCKELGEEWYLPALGELSFLQENKSMVDSALILSGGEPLFYGWHWTSTRKSDNCNWVLSWDSGGRDDCYLYLNLRVRPVSAFL